MKKIFLFILIFICLKSFGQQYPSKQTLGSPTSKLEVLGGVHAVKGLINGRYADTTAANLGYIDSYHGSQIFTTTDKILWWRDSVLNKWVNLSAGGSATDTSNKWVNNITKNAGGDSLIYYINTTRFAVSDPSGGGSTDSSIFATQYDINKTTECPIRFDTLSQVKIVDGDLVTFRDNAFPTLEHGNQDSILMGYWKGRNHSNAGLPNLRFLSNYGLTIGANIDIETDTVRNYTGLVVSKMRADTILFTYSSGDDGTLYSRYSVNGGVTRTSRVVIPIASGSYGVFVNKGKVFNGLNIIPYYTVSPSPVKSGVLVNHRLNGGTWDTITFANSTALQLNESALEVYPDSIYAWLRSDLNTTTVYRSASADGRIWTVPVAITVPEWITGKPDVIRMPDNRLLMNYRGREVPPDVPDEGALAISNDRGITWTKFLYDQVQVYFTYGASLYLGDATYINVHATQLVSGYGDIYRDYYNIAGCGVDALATGIERPGSAFQILADYINRRTAASGDFVHITDIDESPLGEKDWQDTAIFRKQLSVYSSILIPASGNTGFLRVESSGGNLPAYISGQGLDIWRQGISSYNYTTSARGPLDLYASAFSLNIGDVTFGPLSGTGNRIMGLTSAGVAYRTTVDPSSITTWTATAPIVITASDISANAATTSTTGVVSLDANHFNVTGPGAVTLDLVNGPMAQPSAAGYMSTATQDIAGIKRYVNAMSIRTGVNPIGAITALALGQSTVDQGIGIIHVSSNANTGLNHVAGKFLIGVATNAAPTTHTNRLELFEPTATGTDPIVRLGDADLTINHDGTANYAGNLGIATTVPTEKLHVTGNIRFSGALMPNNTAGTAGQVLTSAGAGTVPTWTTPSAGGSGVLYYRDPLFEVNDSTLGVDSTKMKIWPGSIIAGATIAAGGADIDLDGNDLSFSDLGSFNVGPGRVYVTPTTSYLISPDGNSSVSVTNNEVDIATNSTNLSRFTVADKIDLFPYRMRLNVDSLEHSLVGTGKMMVWDSASGRVTTRAIPSGGSGDMVLASVQTVTGAKTFNDTKLLLRNVANTFNGSFVNTNTADRIYTLPNASGTVALTSGAGLPGEWIIACSDETTAITTGTAKVTFRVPFAATVTAVRASINTVSSSGIPTFDINEAGTTILSTKLTIDASEKTSTTAAAAAVISDTALADDAEITIDFDVAGTGAKGVKIIIYYTRN